MTKLDFDTYQEFTKTTAKYPSGFKEGLMYLGLGLNGEAGEIAEKLKKIMRDDGGIVSEEKRQEIKKEIGDNLWYLSQLCCLLGFTLEEAARGNVEKLTSRLERDAINGSGDNR